MSLVPNTYTYDRFDENEFVAPYPWTQGARQLHIECGWHVLGGGEGGIGKRPSGNRAILIEKITQTVGWYSRVIHREEELWNYEVAGAPPIGYSKKVWGRVFLPGQVHGPEFKLLEEEEAEFRPWTGFQPLSPNLSSLRTFKTWVIYDVNLVQSSLTADEIAKAEERGLEIGPAGIIVDSARTVAEAIDENGLIDVSEQPQTAKWKVHRTVAEIVFENMDAFHVYQIEHDRIRPGPPRVTGPSIQKKEAFKYRLPVPVRPPTIDASEVTGGILVEVEGGGATVGGREIPPTHYRIMRRKVSEPDRTASGDPFDRWDSDPAAEPRRKFLAITSTTDLAGTPASPLPGQETYTEPGDTTEPVEEGWKVIAEIENEQPETEIGKASTLDDDVVNLGVYEYQATARIDQDESLPSDIVRVTYGGATTGSRIKVAVKRDEETGELEIDVLAPEDPAFAGEDYGEVEIFEPPVIVEEEEAEDFGLEIGGRQFVKRLEPRLDIKADLNIPLLGLERGQLVKLPTVSFRVTGNELQIETATESDTWILEGFRRKVTRRDDGLLEGFNMTELELTEP
ncbi:MAG: hypothetical protein AMS19_02600 [Gemmatimonas sp. SG8_23]|nr:MAG: hypothetical protein AMS19_02600 [Gemmatimonas sp. SG8_23]